MKIKHLNDLQNMDWKVAHVTYEESNWDVAYTKQERTYEITKGANFFNPDKISGSLFGNCLDGIDTGVRLDLYNWKIENIEIVERG